MSIPIGFFAQSLIKGDTEGIPGLEGLALQNPGHLGIADDGLLAGKLKLKGLGFIRKIDYN